MVAGVLTPRDMDYSENPISESSLVHSAAWFVFGIALMASAWLNISTGEEALRALMPADTALLTALGLQSAVLASAYFFARLLRRRFFWLLVYLLSGSLLATSSYVGSLRYVLGRFGQQPGLNATAEPQRLVSDLQTLRHPDSLESIVAIVVAAFVLLPLLGLLGTRFDRPSFSERVATFRRRMKEMSSQVEATEGLFSWAARILAGLFFNKRQVDPRLEVFQAEMRALQEAVKEALLSFELPVFISEELNLRIGTMAATVENLAFSTQNKFDHEGLLALTDCLDTVEMADIDKDLKQALRDSLRDHFNRYRESSRRFTWADQGRGNLYMQANNLRKDLFTDARSEKTLSQTGQFVDKARTGDAHPEGNLQGPGPARRLERQHSRF